MTTRRITHKQVSVGLEVTDMAVLGGNSEMLNDAHRRIDNSPPRTVKELLEEDDMGREKDWKLKITDDEISVDLPNHGGMMVFWNKHLWDKILKDPKTCHKEAEANARRVVACVNACHGIKTEILEEVNKRETPEESTFKFVLTEYDGCNRILFMAIELAAYFSNLMSTGQKNEVRFLREHHKTIDESSDCSTVSVLRKSID